MKCRDMIFTVLGIMLGILLTVSASSLINSHDVLYDNTGSNCDSTNVQDAIDDLYSKVIIGDATEENILEGTISLSQGNIITGTMPNKGDWTSSPTTSGQISIPKGYHSGNGYVDTTGVWDAAVTAADGRSAPGTVNYQSGYDEGYSAACGAKSAKYYFRLYFDGNGARFDLMTGPGGSYLYQLRNSNLRTTAAEYYTITIQ